MNWTVHAAPRSHLKERHRGRLDHGSGKVLASASRPPVKLSKVGLNPRYCSKFTATGTIDATGSKVAARSEASDLSDSCFKVSLFLVVRERLHKEQHRVLPRDLSWRVGGTFKQTINFSIDVFLLTSSGSSCLIGVICTEMHLFTTSLEFMQAPTLIRSVHSVAMYPSGDVFSPEP